MHAIGFIQLTKKNTELFITNFVKLYQEFKIKP